MTAALTDLQIRWLLVALALVVIPHAFYQPLWVSLFFALMLGWRLLHTQYRWPLPGRAHRRLMLVKHGLALISFVLVFATYGNTIGRDAGLALLVMLLGLKLVEIHNRRDFFVTCCIGYFLVITHFFYSQTIPAAVMMMLAVVFITASLVSLHDPAATLNTRSRLRLSLQLLLQAVPVALLLFVLFPRISGPLWGLPQDAYGHTSGLSEEMAPGRISQLSLSDAIAFRVQFEGTPPPQRDLYWRGPVLWHSDGEVWSQDRQRKRDTANAVVTPQGPVHRYRITVEPHNQNWLFALEMPASAPPGSFISQDLQLLSRKPVQQRRRYDLRSFSQYRLEGLSQQERLKALQLPIGKHPRAIALAEQWRQQSASAEEIVGHALRLFADQGYAYTLSPPAVPGDFVDGFLFESRKGFCEHYSAAFTVLMRAAGVPARVVTGYQGGEMNPVDGYLLIRQRDAHAWAEVWIDGRGWLRVDPTSAVSPTRIELGMEILAPSALRAPLFIAENQTLVAYWQNLRHRWDALNNAWNQWVLGYGPKRQKELLQRLGMAAPDWQQMMLWLTGLSLMVMLAIGLWLVLLQAQQDPVRKTYARFVARLRRFGLQPAASEGPWDFCQRACHALPADANSIEHITKLYIDLRYGSQRQKLQDLRDAIRRFRPGAGTAR